MKPARYKSLDVFRGLTVCIMIVVNTAGAGAEPFATLQHAQWFGFTLADVVFPSFLFAVGNAMSFAMKPGVSHQDYLLKVLKRTGIIFLLGYLMYWFPFVHQQGDGSWAFNPIGETRIMGVLQRIALCFGIAAIACRYLSVKYLIALCVLLLVGYWSILMMFGVPGQQLTPLGNAGALLDQAVLGINHMYRKGHGYDPEGLLSTLPAIVNVIAGYLAGRYISRSENKSLLVRNLLIGGAVFVAAGLLWSLGFPLAKRIWTSSFVLLTIGIDLVILGGLISYVEIAGQTRGTKFFEIFGRNPLAIYLFSELFVTVLQLIKVNGEGLYDWIGIHLFQAVIPGALGSLICAIVYMLVCWGLGFLLDRKNIIIKI
ncbi:acyltransferase family protein [Asticcacaulis taihuensis]|uniref:Predicted acyltransferase n=1 Tax=Asticcacaulis taihuensis TaxID=260084 RepID=A0A1G4TGD3_9CAUL|nr:heparan-alpha-glucosaminide N-acetyltransferase domain-containing protein [Asticcacaulis taihuensis]SCW80307.1 Predicted acyltransferase [Asticcacaulis taihuensis]